MKYNLHTLDNGLRIILTPMKSSSTATCLIMTGTGSRYENKSENGLAHFLEHMFFKGTKKRPNTNAISQELDAIGGMYNAFTGKDRTAYYAKVSHDKLDVAIDVISDIFLNSKLPQKEIDKERGAILQEIDMYADMPRYYIDDIFDAAFFSKGTALTRTILGPKKNIRNFSRGDFTKYLKRNYNTKNTVVSIAGNFNEKEVLATLKKTFTGMNTGVMPTCELAKLTNKLTPQVSIKYKKTEQTQIMLGIPAYEYGHKDTFTQMMLHNVLSGGMSSRLFTEVREKLGLAYSIHAQTERYPDIAYMAVLAGIEHRNLSKTTGVIIDVFKKLKKIKITNKELAKARENILGHKALQNETTDAIATTTATQILSTGKVLTEAELKKGLTAVTTSDIKRVANDLFVANKLTLAVIGPHKSTPKLMEALNKL